MIDLPYYLRDAVNYLYGVLKSTRPRLKTHLSADEARDLEYRRPFYALHSSTDEEAVSALRAEIKETLDALDLIYPEPEPNTRDYMPLLLEVIKEANSRVVIATEGDKRVAMLLRHIDAVTDGKKMAVADLSQDQVRELTIVYQNYLIDWKDMHGTKT